MKQDFGSIRNEYLFGALDEKDADSNPVNLFQVWLQEALIRNLPRQNAFTLSTTSDQGSPSSRVMLLKGIDHDEFIFFTNYNSRKSQAIASNPNVACNFFWPELDRQVTLEGRTKRTSIKESDDYFKTRPRLSQLGAWASAQSSVIKDRKVLEERLLAYDIKFEGREVPRPEYWGGYRIVPKYMEFWQGREGRMHDRLVFSKSKSGWKCKRLAP